MKRKIFLISTSVLLLALVIIFIASRIVLTNPSDYGMKILPNMQLITLTEKEEKIAAVTVKNGNEYTLSLFDKTGARLWDYSLTSYCTLLKSEGNYIIVGVGKEVKVFDMAGASLFSTTMDFNPVDVAFKDGVFAVASSASKMKNRISVYNIDSENNVVFDGKTDTNKSIVEIALHDGAVYFGTGSQIFRMSKSSGEYTAREIAKTTNNHLGLYVGNSGTLYVSSDVGTLEIQKEVDGKYEVVDTVQFGKGGNYIAENGNGLIATFDYLGNALVYDTVNQKTVVKFMTETSSSNASINSDGTLLILRTGKEISFYDVTEMKSYSFFQRAELWITVFIVLFAVMEVVAIFLNNKRTGATLVSVGQKMKASRKCYLYLLPAFGLLLIFNFYPIFSGFSLAFQDYFPGVRADFVQFDNFLTVFSDATFWSGTGNMLIFLASDLFKAVICSLIVAEIIISVRSQLSQYWARFLMYLPGILPGVAGWLIWQEGILGADGVISQIMGNLGVERYTNFNFLGDASTAKWALIFIGFPWTGSYLIVYGALRSVPESIYDAAKLDGFSWLKKITYIDIPMIFPQLKYIFIVHFISSIQNFSRVYITTNGAFDTQIPALSLYQQITTHQNYGVAAAMGVLLFVFIFGISILNLKTKLKGED